MNKYKAVFGKKSVVVLFFLLFAALPFIDVINAYYTDADCMVNDSSIGGNNVEIVEDFEPPKEFVPGVSFKKDVCVKNTGPSDCYVRMKVVFSDSDIGAYCSVDWNTQDWVYDAEEDYYYYTESISKGEFTSSLFTTVTVSNMISQDQIKDFDIIVYTESYQALGFADYKSAWLNYEKNKP